MKNDSQRRLVQGMLDLADVQIDGGRPFDIKVNDPRLYSAVLGGGTMGLGEAYMDGWWDCPALDQFFERVLSAGLEKQSAGTKALLWAAFKTRVLNPQRLTKAFEIGEHHYDIGNDLFVKMLDKGLNYSCGYWESAATLDQAQEAKLDLICRKLDLRDGMRVLDIGCGWGGFAMYAAEKYGAHVTGVSVSREQIDLAEDRAAGLPVDFELMDYRSVSGSFDRIVSIGMFEHVGVNNYRTFMEVTRRSLADDGLMLLHTIGRNKSGRITEPWIAKYIFPNSMIPSAAQISDRRGRPVRPRGLAQLRSELRSHSHGVEPELRQQLGLAQACVRRAFLPDVDVLPAVLRRQLQSETQPGVAGRPQPERRQGWVSGGAVDERLSHLR